MRERVRSVQSFSIVIVASSKLPRVLIHDRRVIDNTPITNDNQVQAAVLADDRPIPTKVLGHERKACPKESLKSSIG
jgi:hypothetical protein